jgi:hypothetical protein
MTMAVCGATVPSKALSGDDFYGPLIASQAMVSFFWNTYGFKDSSAATTWTNGWGYEDPYNTDLPLARTFTGLYALTYSAPNWQDDSYSSTMLNFARRYVRENIDDLRARCGNGTAAAHSFYGPLVDDRVELYKDYWYTSVVVERASTLLHEARHMGGKSHNADFPPWSVYSGSGADTDWAYDGAWAYDTNYLWWFYTQGTNTTSGMKNIAKQLGNFMIQNCFATRPPFVIA